MPPADPAAIHDAVATVRKYDGGNYPAYQAACGLIARHFLSLLDAGELVRAVQCGKCDGTGGLSSWFNDFGHMVVDKCENCNGSGTTLEPLFAKEVGT